MTSGASAPEFLVGAVVARLRALGAGEIRTIATVDEDVHFALPPEVAVLRAERPSEIPALS